MNPSQPLSLEWLIASGQEVTEEKLEAARQVQKYENRDKIPEPLLWMADLYHELTKQLPNKAVYSEWIKTFEIWKMELFQPEHIRAAFARAMQDDGFPVGRPNALTATARAMKTKMLLTEPKETVSFFEGERELTDAELEADRKAVQERVQSAMQRLEEKRKAKGMEQ